MAKTQKVASEKNKSSKLDPRNRRQKLNRRLKKAGVRADFIRGAEEIFQLQQAMLGNFARENYAARYWGNLKNCKEGKCGRAQGNCSGACWYGGREKYLEYVVQAATAIAAISMRNYTTCIIHPLDRCELGNLWKLRPDAIKRRIQRACREIEMEAGPLHAAGAIEASLEEDEKGRYWQPHVHLIVATHCPIDRLSQLLRPKTKGKKGSRPIVVQEVTDLGNAVSYAMKDQPWSRAPATGKRGERNPEKSIPERGPERLEYDRWLHKFGNDRIVVRNMKRVHGKLIALRSKTSGSRKKG